MTLTLAELLAALIARGIRAAALAGSRAAARRRGPAAIPFGRVHLFGYGLSDPPTCAYCGTALTSRNQYAACMGPPDAPPPCRDRGDRGAP